MFLSIRTCIFYFYELKYKKGNTYFINILFFNSNLRNSFFYKTHKLLIIWYTNILYLFTLNN